MPPPHFITLIQKSQLDVECCGLKAIEPAVVTDDIMFVFSEPSVFSQSPQRLGKVRIAGDNGSTIAAGSQRLSWAETEATRIPHRSSSSPMIQSAVALSSISAHFETASSGAFQYPSYVSLLSR